LEAMLSKKMLASGRLSDISTKITGILTCPESMPSAIIGNSSRQGGHQEAHILIRYGGFKSEFCSVPLLPGLLNRNRGVTCPTRRRVGAPATSTPMLPLTQEVKFLTLIFSLWRSRAS